MGKENLDRFDGTGFHTWQIKLKGYLMKKNLWGVVTQTEESVTTRASQSKESRDEQALGIIITALADSHIHYIDEATTAHKAWETLEKTFGAKAKHSKISLKMQFFGLTLEDNENVTSLINKLKSLVTQLSYIDAKMEEEDKVAVLLKALPAPYHHLVTVLKEKSPIPTLEDAINSIQEEEKKIGVTNKVQAHGGAYMMATTDRRCYECGKTNHLAKDCYSKNPCIHCGGKNHPSSKCYFKDKDDTKEVVKRSSKDKGKGRVHIVESDDEQPNVHLCYESDIL